MDDFNEVDIYRDTPVRFLATATAIVSEFLLGYTNEVGEAFRPLIHKNVVNLSYLAASLYVLADVRDKVLKMKNSLSAVDHSPSSVQKKVLIAGADTLLWQALASIIIPGFCINRFCAANYFLLKKTTKLPKSTRKYITTGLGLMCIPFIIKPIDEFTTYSMDNFIRKFYFKD